MNHITVNTLDELEEHGPVWTYYHLSLSGASAKFLADFGHEPDEIITLADTALPSPVYCVMQAQDMPSARLDRDLAAESQS
jgi:hypothetical protein